MTTFWSIYISVITIGTLVGCFWLVRYTMRVNPNEQLGENELNHRWDGDLVEYNNPLPKWWLNLFYGTIVFAAIYLTLYPGLGTWEGVFGWTSHKQYDQEVEKAAAKYDPLYAKYAQVPLAELTKNDEAMKIGQSLFGNNCAQCHGSFGLGNKGFPNLTDKDWIWGGKPETVEQTILHGRNAAMPAWGPTLGEDGVKAVAEYVLSFTGRESDKALAEKGKQTFNTMCIGCHGADGKGNQMLGAANLTDDYWLYGSSKKDIIETITHGRNGKMPAWEKVLGKDKAHLVAAYVLSLSQDQ